MLLDLPLGLAFLLQGSNSFLSLTCPPQFHTIHLKKEFFIKVYPIQRRRGREEVSLLFFVDRLSRRGAR
jgi:hypothetical protein